MAVIRVLLPVIATSTQSASIEVINHDQPVAIRAFGTITSSETIGDIQYQDNAGNWVDYGYNGAKVSLTDVDNAFVLVHAGVYRVDKDVTSDTVGIEAVYEKTVKSAAS